MGQMGFFAHLSPSGIRGLDRQEPSTLAKIDEVGAVGEPLPWRVPGLARVARQLRTQARKSRGRDASRGTRWSTAIKTIIALSAL